MCQDFLQKKINEIRYFKYWHNMSKISFYLKM